VHHFLYPRHFLLLTAFAVMLGTMSRLHLSSDLSVSFAMYGALHASALVLSLRAHHPFWRRCWFIVIAAALSVMTLRIGIFATQLSEALAGNVGRHTVLGLSAATGAVTYGIAIQAVGFYKLTAGLLAIIAIGCVSAALLGLFTLGYVQFLGQSWLAILWWYAFSGGLWYSDQPLRSRGDVAGRRDC
jgi:hypothetical protein